MTTQVMTREILGVTAFLTATYRGTSYCLSRDIEGGWQVATRRIALGRPCGGCKWFETLADVKASCKAFAAVDLTEAL